MRYVAHDSDLRRVLDVVSTRRESAVVISGSRGSGKTHFLYDVAEAAPFDVVRLTMNSRESHWPLSGVLGLLSHFSSPGVYEVVKALQNQGTSMDAFSIGQDVLRAFQSLAAHPTIVLIDDVHQMDALSQEVLGFLLRRLTGTGLRFVVTLATDPEEGPLDGLPLIVLESLNSQRIMRLTETEVTGELRSDVLHIIAEYASGVPAAAVAMARMLPLGQRSGIEPLHLPPRLDARASRAALGEVPDPGLNKMKVLQMASSISELSMDAVLAVNPEGDSSLRLLLDSGLLTRTGSHVSIASGRLRSAIYWNMSGDERDEIHQSLSDKGSDSEKAWHRSFLHQDAICPSLLLGSALAAVQQGHVLNCIELAERAIAVCPLSHHASDTLLDIAESLFGLGRIAYSKRYLHLVDPSQSPKLAIRLAKLRILAEFHSTTTVHDHLASEVVGANGEHEPGCAVDLLATMTLLYLDRWDLDRAGQHLKEATELSLAHGMGRTPEIEAAENLRNAMLYGPSGIERFTSPREAEGNLSPTALLAHASALTYAERYDECEQVLDSILSSAPAGGSVWSGLARLSYFANEYRAGNMIAADLTLGRVRAASDVEVHTVYRECSQIWHSYRYGTPEKVRHAYVRLSGLTQGRRNCLADSSNDALYGAFLLHRGEFAEALRTLQRCYEAAERSGTQSLLRADADLIEALVVTGDTARAANVYAKLGTRAAYFPSRWAELALSRSAALIATGDESLRRFEETIRLHREGDSLYELARTYSAFAGRLAEQGHAVRARQANAAAQTQFLALRMTEWSKALENRYGANDQSSRSGILEQLTDDQRDVALLVADGCRSKEIADKLFVSVRTVEVRLTGIYRTLGLRSRVELTAALRSLENTAVKNRSA